MARSLRERSAPTLRWWVQRNPAYVLSAACIAYGARMLLVPDPAPPPGDVVLMFTVLGVLQAYEMLVTSILITLRRTIRAPEDQPSILIIGTIFWSGPLIATMELTAAKPTLGFALAMGACVVAIGEVLAVARTFDWQLERATPLMAGSFLALVAVAQPLLRASADGSDAHEIVLYVLWWVVALAMIIVIPVIRRARNMAIDSGIIAAAAGAAMMHLYAMNHAFYGHARVFYVVPTLVAGAIAGMWLTPRSESGRESSAFLLACWAPFIGICLAIDRFDSAVPSGAIPTMLCDPLLVSLGLASIAWGVGFARHRWEPLRHFGSLALIFTTIRLYALDLATVHASSGRLIADIISTREWGTACIAAAWYGAYFAWRDRNHVLAAFLVLVHQFGVWLILPVTWRYGELLNALAWGWAFLIYLHLISNRSALFLRLIPITWLTLISAVTAVRPSFLEEAYYAKLHGVALIGVLAIWGWIDPPTRYRMVAFTIASLFASPLVVRWVRDHPQGPASAVIVAGFALLAGGMWISWHKRALLERLPEWVPIVDDVEPDPPVNSP